MEGVFPKSDSVAQQRSLLSTEQLEAGQPQAIHYKIASIALGAIALVAGIALLVTGIVLFKAVFPLGIFAAAAIPLTLAAKAQVAGSIAMIFAGFGLQAVSVSSFIEASRY